MNNIPPADSHFGTGRMNLKTKKTKKKKRLLAKRIAAQSQGWLTDGSAPLWASSF